MEDGNSECIVGGGCVRYWQWRGVEEKSSPISGDGGGIGEEQYGVRRRSSGAGGDKLGLDAAERFTAESWLGDGDSRPEKQKKV